MTERDVDSGYGVGVIGRGASSALSSSQNADEACQGVRTDLGAEDAMDRISTLAISTRRIGQALLMIVVKATQSIGAGGRSLLHEKRKVCTLDLAS
jgi:hypothetical protein